jgi:large subunit ribosomal protein L13
MDTYVLKASDIKPKWYVVDANGQILGRVATKVASVLRGKHKVTFAPNLDNGDYVIIINADKVKVTGKKLDQKVYFHHTGWIGGAKFETLKVAMDKHPEKVLEHAVKGMLPKGPLGRKMYKKLFVYAGENHPHIAQKPEVLAID